MEIEKCKPARIAALFTLRPGVADTLGLSGFYSR